jgi:hypothetical protein
MDLQEWMRANGLVDEDVSDAVGCTRSYLTRIRGGLVHPSLGTALAIRDFTKGEVEIEYLLPRHMRPNPTPRARRGPQPNTTQKQPARSTSRARAKA